MSAPGVRTAGALHAAGALLTDGGRRTSDYAFELPESQIAQVPAARRDASRLMVVHRETGAIEHRVFGDLGAYLRAGDALVLNTTRVFKARLLGHRDSGAPAEIFLLRELRGELHDELHDELRDELRGELPEKGRDEARAGLGTARWEAMVQPGNKLKPGRRVHVAPGFDVEVLEATERGTRVVRLHALGASVHEMIAAHGHIPLPPYIARGDGVNDVERYQTVFAREEGSVAAPTAGLHFTPELLTALERQGVRRAEVLLHVGAGTFKPVEVEDPAEHVMHEEWYDVSVATAALLNATRAEGGRICCVGTTSLRTIESALDAEGRFRAGSGETRIFIRPPARPRAADLLVTNFHLPRSTLLMLVAAMAGHALTMHAYDVAVREGYRFYSYGDAMLIT